MIQPARIWWRAKHSLCGLYQTSWNQFPMLKWEQTVSASCAYWSICDFPCALVSLPDQWQWFWSGNETACAYAYNIRKWQGYARREDWWAHWLESNARQIGGHGLAVHTAWRVLAWCAIFCYRNCQCNQEVRKAPGYECLLSEQWRQVEKWWWCGWRGFWLLLLSWRSNIPDTLKWLVWWCLCQYSIDSYRSIILVLSA